MRIQKYDDSNRIALKKLFKFADKNNKIVWSINELRDNSIVPIGLLRCSCCFFVYIEMEYYSFFSCMMCDVCSAVHFVKSQRHMIEHILTARYTLACNGVVLVIASAARNAYIISTGELKNLER